VSTFIKIKDFVQLKSGFFVFSIEAQTAGITAVDTRKCGAMCCSVLQCVAVSCIKLQSVFHFFH